MEVLEGDVERRCQKAVVAHVFGTESLNNFERALCRSFHQSIVIFKKQNEYNRKERVGRESQFTYTFKDRAGHQMTTVFNDNASSVQGYSTENTFIGSRRGISPALAQPIPLLVPTPPTEQEVAYDKALSSLLQSFETDEYRASTPAPIAVSINSTNPASMSVFSTPSPPFLDPDKSLVPVPLRLIPMLSKKITDRHLRETYRYYKWFVNKDTRAAISEWPEGALEKDQWKQRMLNVGRDIRFLGRKRYQKAVEETIRAKGLTMNCGQNPTSWSDCLGALFNPDQYTEERRELVYWIQFGLLKESNNSWIHKQETDWCASVYGIKIVYNKNWEGNAGQNSIDQTVHGESFLPFVRARGSWFKWFFMKGANEIREVIQGYSLRTHGIYERICVTKNKNAAQRMTYTKRTFAHGDGYIAQPIEKRRKQAIRSTMNQPFTMETVTAWLEQQGKSVNDKPATLYLNSMVNCEMSSMTNSASNRNSTVTNIAQLPTAGLPSTVVNRESRGLTAGLPGADVISDPRGGTSGGTIAGDTNVLIENLTTTRNECVRNLPLDEDMEMVRAEIC